MDQLRQAHRRAHDHVNRKRQDDSQGGGVLTVFSVVTLTRPAGGASLIAPTTSIAPTTIRVTSTAERSTITVTPTTRTVSATTLAKSTRSKSSSASKTSRSSKSSSKISSISHLTTAPASSTAYSTSNSISSSSTYAASSSAAAAAPAGGLSTGAYAGIIGGGVGLALLILGVFALVYRSKSKKKNYTKPEDEKALNRSSSVFQGTDRFSPSPVLNTPAKPPRLSLAPMTNFMPGLAGSPNGNSNNQNSREVVGGVAQPPAALMLDNLNEKDLLPSVFANPAPSPALSAFSDSPSANGGAASPSPVHRIMIDFNPSMGDELELRTGELVRMLHEYDDGWALCIRMDRSQQGVCPRTCLSQRPVKPRPPPGAQQGRPQGPSNNMGPNSHRGPPMNNNGPQRPQNGSRPSSPSMSNGPRPQSPGMGPRNGPPQGQNRGPDPNKMRQPPNGGSQGQQRGPGGPNSQRQAQGIRPESPSNMHNGRQPHPLREMQKGDDVEFHAM